MTSGYDAGKEASPAFASEPAAIAALNHARTMVIHAAELRVKNFNFFLVLLGVLIAAFVKGERQWVLVVVATAGGIVSLLFLLVDIRVMRLIKDARADLKRIEPMFDITIHTVDAIRDLSRGIESSSRSRIITTTSCYRTMFILSFVVSLFSLWLALTCYPWL